VSTEGSSLSRRPAVRLALLVIAGILFAQYVSLAPSVVYGAVVVSALAALVGYLRSRRSTVFAVALHFAVFLVGFYLAGVERQKVETETLRPHHFDEPIVLQGYLESEPVKKSNRVEMVVQTSKIARAAEGEGNERRVLVIVRQRRSRSVLDSLRTGTEVRIRGSLEPVPGPRNPGDFDYGRYLALNGIFGVVSVGDSGSVEVLPSAQRETPASFLASAQKTVYEILDRFHTPEQASFLKGLVFGHRSDISLDIKQSFIATGTIHVLAVSGLHVGVVALIFYSLAGLFRLSKRWVVIVTILGLICYMFITGQSPSVVRATVMATVILLGTLFERKTDVYNSLAAAGLLMLLWDPKYLFEVGFQLSFAAVLSIVYFYPKLESLIRRIPERFEEIKAIDYVLKLFAVSLAAQLGTLPFTAYYFGRVSIVALVANLVVVPVAGFNVMLGFATVAFSFVSDWVARCYAELNGVLVTFLLGFVKAAAKVPLAYYETAGIAASFPIFYYLGVGAVFNVNKPRTFTRCLIALLIVLNVLLYYDIFSAGRPSLVVTVLDVGQGDALFLEFPNRKCVLVDAGPKSFTYDAGERLVAPFLKRKGCETIDALVVTHAHADHLGGVKYLLEHFRVGRLIQAGNPPASQMFREVVAAAQQNHVPVERTSMGQVLSIDTTARVFVLSPNGRRDSSRNLNNRSIVLKVVYGKTSFLLQGDAETEVEDDLLHRYGPILPSDVLKAGHHGSITSSSIAFLKRVRPAIALISVGMNNKFGHPSPVVLSRFREMGVRIERTDEEGAAMVRSDGEGCTIVDWRKSRSIL
jgi:competence protein ComEC